MTLFYEGCMQQSLLDKPVTLRFLIELEVLLLLFFFLGGGGIKGVVLKPLAYYKI